MKRKSTRLFVFFLVAILAILPSLSVSAIGTDEIPYESYTYWEQSSGTDKKAVYSKPMYEAGFVIDANYVGEKEFTNLSDVCVDDKGNVYILDGGASVIYIFDSNYNFLRTIKGVVYGGETLDFKGAKSIFVSHDNTLYISDTENNRVLKSDLNGNVLYKYLMPKSDLIPDNFQFNPIKTAVDNKGYFYILCDGSYYGAILYSPNDEFLGFFGSNDTKVGVVQAIANFINNLFTTNEKLSKSESKLPFTITDLDIDNKNFVYTCTGKTGDTNATGQIRKFSPGGIVTNDTSDYNFADITSTDVAGVQKNQDLAGIALDEDGYLYTVDSTYGRIFLYDREYRLLSVFGSGLGKGKQKGTFVLPGAIDVKGDDVLVCDISANCVTVFKITEYGKLVKNTRLLTLNGQYKESKEGWEKILTLDRNNQLAYNGLAKAYYADGNYKKALDYAEKGLDKDTYALAFKWVRRDYISDNFWWIFTAAIAVIGALCAFLVFITKKKVRIIKNEKVSVMLSCLTHPFDSFSKVKYDKKGSVTLSVFLLFLFYVTTVMQSTLGGYLFVNYDASNFNSLYVLLRTIGLVALWSITNWAVCVLMGGIGKLKEIFIVTCYCVMPLIIKNVLYLVFTNVLLPSEASALGVISYIAIIYTGFLLIVGSLKIHDYDFGRFAGTGILSVAGMAIVLCVCFIIIILIQQFGAFLITLSHEIIYR